MITQAFIFAAGRGERMRPLTDSIPKPLIKVKNKSIIDYSIEKLDKIPSVKKIIINGFYLANQIKNHIKNRQNPKLIFSHETSKIETGGGLVYAQNKFNANEPLLLINGDILWQEEGISDIEKLCQSYNPNDCDILLGLKKTGEILGYEGKGDFDLDEKTGELSKKDGPASHVFVGLQVINPKILQNPPSECFSMNHFYKKAQQNDGKLKRIKGLELSGRYFHIGDVKALQEVEEVL